jgi:hypothetical protein
VFASHAGLWRVLSPHLCCCLCMCVGARCAWIFVCVAVVVALLWVGVGVIVALLWVCVAKCDSQVASLHCH